MLRRSGASSYSRDHIKFIFCPSAWKREIDEVLSAARRDRPLVSSLSLSFSPSCVCSQTFHVTPKRNSPRVRGFAPSYRIIYRVYSRNIADASASKSADSNEENANGSRFPKSPQIHPVHARGMPGRVRRRRCAVCDTSRAAARMGSRD